MWDHKDKCCCSSVIESIVTLPTECFLRPVKTDHAHPTMAPVCVWYMEAFVTLGGVLSVRLTITLCECFWERVAIVASLLLYSAPPLFCLTSCLSIFLLFLHSSLHYFPFSILLFFPHSVNHCSCLSLLPCCHSIAQSPFNPSSPSLTLHLSFPSLPFFPPLLLPFLPSTNTQPH